MNPSDDLPAAREVVIHAHFDASLSGDTTVLGPTGRMDHPQRLVLLDQVRSWCADTRTKITVKPVIDLNTPLTAHGHDIPDRIREQVQLRDRASSRGAPAPPDAATSTTSPPTTTMPTPRADPSPGPPAPTTSPASAASTTG